MTTHVKANSVCTATAPEIDEPVLRMIESTDTIKHLPQATRTDLIEELASRPQTNKPREESKPANLKRNDSKPQKRDNKLKPYTDVIAKHPDINYSPMRSKPGADR